MKIELPLDVNFILSALEKSGFEAYVVGGSLRDTLLGLIPGDWDICTNALPEEVIKVFNGERVIETGLKHGTVTLMLKGNAYEITTYRTDGVYTDNRHPEKVSFVKSLKEDLSRRDFTVNAMAYNPSSGIVDLFGGTKDLKKGVLRCVGNPKKRFEEDALRILRGLRFSSTYGFSFDEETKNAIFFKKSLIKNISRERINSEFSRLLEGSFAPLVLKSFECVFFEFLPYSKNFSLAAEKLSQVAELSYKKAFFLSFLYDDPEIVRSALKNLKCDNKYVSFSKNLCLALKEQTPHSPQELYMLYKNFGKEAGEAACRFLAGNDAFFNLEKAAKEKALCYNLKQLNLKGSDLPYAGSQIGEALEDALLGVINGCVSNEKKALLKYIELLQVKKNE